MAGALVAVARGSEDWATPWNCHEGSLGRLGARSSAMLRIDRV